MFDISKVKNAIPDELILKEVIESGMISVLADDTYGINELEVLFEAMTMLASKVNVGFRVAFYDELLGKDNYENLARQYGFPEKCFYVGEKAENIITNFLCSHVLITTNPDGECVKLAKELYIPVFCVKENLKRVYFDDDSGIFHINNTPESIAAALLIIKEKKYRALFSGFTK